MRCSINGSFGNSEIPLLVSFLYLFDEVELGIAYFLVLMSFAGKSTSKTLPGGEFGWGGTSVKR